MPIQRYTSEAEVVYSLKRQLLTQGVLGLNVSQVLVDADGAYKSSRFAHMLEPMAAVRIDGFRPDILCSIQKESLSILAAFEVKAHWNDWPRGLSQARWYRSGVHHSYLAIPAPEKENQQKLKLLREDAREKGVGVLLKSSSGWDEIIAPPDPRPLPWTYATVRSALEGIPITRRLQLNHPLNYIVVPFLRFQDPDAPLESLLQINWLDLQRIGTRRHAIEGANHLGLITREGRLTTDGLTVAELLAAVDFDPRYRHNKKARLCDASPPLAAITRSVLLRQASVRLTIKTLMTSPWYSLNVIDLFTAGRTKDDVLATALFLSDPGNTRETGFLPTDFNPSAVFKFKQVLWHSGILATKAHASAGKSASSYHPTEDIWSLDKRYIRHL